jgi:RNA polymerase sigma-70 factor (ECF subfamily)
MAGLAQTCSGHGAHAAGLALCSAHRQDSTVLPSDDLAALLIATGSGDRIAFRRLYDSVSPKLFAIIRRISRNAAGSEEILQDVFLRVWNNAASFSPEAGSAMAWLITIARNRAIDVIRQKAPLLAVSAGDKPHPYDTIPDPVNSEARLNDIAVLRNCLGAIEEPTRSCILLAYYEGFSRDELAAKYATPVNTIKSWLHRGLASLRECLERAA